MKCKGILAQTEFVGKIGQTTVLKMSNYSKR